jgi:hypothetical protein
VSKQCKPACPKQQVVSKGAEHSVLDSANNKYLQRTGQPNVSNSTIGDKSESNMQTSSLEHDSTPGATAN